MSDNPSPPPHPVRVVLSRRKGWRMPPNTIKVSRPSKYGNPHHVGFCPVCGVKHTQKEAVAEFQAMLEHAEIPPDLSELRGKNLACWCKEGSPCHADVILQLANPKHGWRSACDPLTNKDVWTYKTFSISFFRISTKANGKESKKPIGYRLSGPCSHRDAVVKRAEEIVAALNAGWTPTKKSERFVPHHGKCKKHHHSPSLT